MVTNSALRRVLKDVGGAFGAGVIGLVLVAAAFGPFFGMEDPRAQDLSQRYLPPVWIDGGDSDHILGTDHLGRDLASRVVEGARVTVLVGVGAVLIQMLIGISLGLLAGFKRGVWDTLVMRLADVWFAVPFLVMAIAIAVVVGTGVGTTILVLGAVGWVTFARVVRAQALSLRERDFVLASQVSGTRQIRTMLVEVFPNLIASVIVVATLQVSQMIILEAALSFLGVGIQPPDIAWGSMISEGRDSLGSAWWVALAPGAALVITTLGINLFGDALRDGLDTKAR